MKKLIGFIILLLFAQNLFCQKISLETKKNSIYQTGYIGFLKYFRTKL